MTFPKLRFLDAERKMPLMSLPVRTVVVELENARVVLSPASTLTSQQLKDLGEVTDLVAPSLLHSAGMEAAAQAHPRARLWGPAGIREKRPQLSWHGILGETVWPYESELSHVAIAGSPGVNESAFVHHPSGALLSTDLFFNIESPKGWGAWLILNIFGTYKRFAASKLFLKYVKDRAAFQSSLERLGAMDFRHVVPAHGEVVRDQGKQKFRAALREHGFAI